LTFVRYSKTYLPDEATARSPIRAFFVELPLLRVVNGASQRQPDRMGSLDPIRHKSYPKNRAKDPSFRGMLCFNRGDRTFLIRKGSPLRMVRLSAQVCERGPKMGDLQCRAFASTGFLH
jgi:hypothetical protein